MVSVLREFVNGQWFLYLGKNQGATVKNGMDMLALQAEKSWEIWNS